MSRKVSLLIFIVPKTRNSEHNTGMNDFWDRLSQCCKDKKITQYNLAEECGITLPTFNRLKKEGKYPKVEVILKMSEVLDKSVQYLIVGNDTEDPAIDYLLKYPEIRDLVELLGKHPEHAFLLKAYLEGKLEGNR